MDCASPHTCDPVATVSPLTSQPVQPYNAPGASPPCSRSPRTAMRTTGSWSHRFTASLARRSWSSAGERHHSLDALPLPTAVSPSSPRTMYGAPRACGIMRHHAHSHIRTRVSPRSETPRAGRQRPSMPSAAPVAFAAQTAHSTQARAAQCGSARDGARARKGGEGDRGDGRGGDGRGRHPAAEQPPRAHVALGACATEVVRGGLGT